MSDVSEGIGGAIEGALAGRAVEPRHGEGSAETGEPQTCLNCGATVTASYCGECGQKRHVHRTISAILHDLIHGVLHLDGKFWETLPLLVFRPGQLTRRYVEGERAKFVSPMAMFLFSVFAMFAVFQIVGISTPTDLEGNARALVTDMVEKETQQVIDKIARIDEELTQSDLDDARRLALEAERTALERDFELLKGRGRNLTRLLASGESDFLDTFETEGESRIAEAKERLATMPEGSSERADLAAEIAAAEKGLSDLRRFEDQAQAAVPFIDSSHGTLTFQPTGIAPIDSFVGKWQSNPSLMLYKMQANGYKFGWLLIPLSIPFVWLTFAWKRRFKAYDHAIFVTYSLSFMSLLFIAISLVGVSPLGAGSAFTIFAIVAPLHVYKHLKYTYGLSRFSTIWRFVFLMVCILIILILFVPTLLLLGAF
ncbi:DUF3667 domain-containing protein [Erythrobacter sp. JK5]|uniref:DUF3667 domain-containing protein n=1 Tax=Erythrobacter sp. JK5 TaxID=2829500 RepID=UPI0020118B20|nr:DUF3667 domain-containing protein [Erythrobacter sp. JK5]